VAARAIPSARPKTSRILVKGGLPTAKAIYCVGERSAHREKGSGAKDRLTLVMMTTEESIECEPKRERK